MANVWFISDIHAGHKNIHNFRKEFDSEEQHYELVKRNYHKVVTKRDKVFFLGDIAFTQERLEDIGKWEGERKVLIAGNHCTDSISMKEIVKHFDEVYSLKKYKEFWLSHAPIHPMELRGKLNVHGHMHYQKIDDERYLNVCLEHTDYYPIDLNEVRRRLGLQTYNEISLKHFSFWKQVNSNEHS